MTPDSPLAMLLVEDNPSDVLLFQEALAAAGAAVDLTVAWNGQEALNLLCGRDPSRPGLRPDVVVLDINLPILGGGEVLTAMATDPDLSTIPVVITTGSRFESHHAALYPADRCLFKVKPVSFTAMVEMVQCAEQFAVSHRAAASRAQGAGGCPLP
jgi:CheY-like chemotaxis protein